jgi:hypothetical protein
MQADRRVAFEGSALRAPTQWNPWSWRTGDPGLVRRGRERPVVQVVPSTLGTLRGLLASALASEFAHFVAEVVALGISEATTVVAALVRS